MATCLQFNPSQAVSHPLGVKPNGNLFFCENMSEQVEHRKKSLGAFFSVLSEELLVDILSYSNAIDLVTISGVSKHMLAYSFHVDLWRDLYWSMPSRCELKSSWRDSVIDSLRQGSLREVKRQRTEPSEIYPVLSNVFSDLLYSPYRSSGLVPTNAWIQRENIDRVDYRSLKDFVDKYERKNTPVIITGFVDSEWNDAVAKWRNGPIEKLAPGNPEMECGAFKFSLEEYAAYIASGLYRLDESPIFIFDTKTFSKSKDFQDMYTKIPFFGDDLFDLLSGEFRPDNAWLLVGPPGASSKWHVDPNSTSAWNAVIKGEKKWILLPPHLGPPPGVEVSSDGFAVRQPLTLTDWLDGGFYADTYRQFAGRGLVEATCREGEIMYVPRGWWHCVRNSGDDITIAITQNYAAECAVDHVRRFLKQYAHCVSGVPQNVRARLWIEFDRNLREKRPELINGDITINEEQVDACGDDVSDNESCCGGEQVSFSFWDHFTTGTKSLNFERN